MDGRDPGSWLRVESDNSQAKTVALAATKAAAGETSHHVTLSVPAGASPGPLRFPVASAPRDVSDNVTPRRATPRRRTYHGPPATLGQYCEFRCAANFARLRATSLAILPVLRTSDQNMEPNKSQPPPYGFQPPPTQPPPYTPTPQAQPYGPPPPQPGYIQHNITVVAPLMLGTDPCTTECPACRATIVTRTSSKPSTNTHLLALLLCIFGLWPCVCVPYCAECAYAVDHFCPNCNAYIGQSMA
ncbi:uncharacterized protein LOC126188419 [Schistocerca cancellata]|uniref:uncharacterized protein LOC126188419 n=1 Tax=Schistocerca cancellata TaxID=274614 RepID=UPI0021187E0D|nr:uncharacterized protein LOC126188419 [Schistocerca cancellata]